MTVQIQTATGPVDVSTLVSGGEHHQRVIATGVLAGGGRKTASASGTGEPLVASSTPCSYALIQGLKANLSDITIGASGVDGASSAVRNGIALGPGEILPLPVRDLVNVYVDVVTDNEGVSFLYFS